MALSPQLRFRPLHLALVVVVAAALVPLALAGFDGSFDKYFQFAPYCKGQYYCEREGDGTVAISAHWNKVGAFDSYGQYQYGIFSVRMKMPAGYSGGIIPCFYLISGNNAGYKDIHDEIDFEILGAKNPREMIIHTNLISGGQTNLEQFTFPFDPSADFHTYTLIYSPRFIVWRIDDTPIRVTLNQPGKPFPSSPVQVRASIWDASSWSPLKPNWGNGKVTAKFRDFDLTMACPVPPTGKRPACADEKNRRKAPWLFNLPPRQIRKFKEFRKGHVKASYGWQPIQ
ncbi:hypothetical protein CLOM_g11168 [Closterium sp. NIES-68]|nr:hypothetical protein CLOM_g11168 [Closterium sp. NIES-68]GJP79592.1 hypothetical protein CLOP_g9809 [Closterium sp. NIES-67]